MTTHLKVSRAVGHAFAALIAVSLSSCSLSDMLDAPDPDLLDPEAVQSAAGATAVRNGALSRLRTMTANGESSWMFGGLLADEWATSSTFIQNDETDQRRIQLNNSTVNGNLRSLYRARTAANQAIVLLNQYKPTPAADIAEMHFVRGFAELQLASDFCNGIPLSDGAGTTATLGTPLTVDSVFGAAIASFDSAINMTPGASAAELAVNRAARIGKARAMIGRNKTNAAAAAVVVAGIPTTYRYDVTASLTGGDNTLWSQAASQNRYTVSDSAQGNNRSILVGNAIPFRAAADRRVPARYRRATNGDTVKAQDGNTFVIMVDSLWGQTTAVAVTHGIDARLIEAEAFLVAGNNASWLATLNALRTATQQLTASSPTATGTHPGWTTPVMAALVDPGTPAARTALHFREMAFWQFGRGHRLGNLRRMIRDYGYAADGSQNYPTGNHYKGTTFGPDLNLPVTTDEQVGNPNFTQCIDRKA